MMEKPPGSSEGRPKVSGELANPIKKLEFLGSLEEFAAEYPIYEDKISPTTADELRALERPIIDDRLKNGHRKTILEFSYPLSEIVTLLNLADEEKPAGNGLKNLFKEVAEKVYPNAKLESKSITSDSLNGLTEKIISSINSKDRPAFAKLQESFFDLHDKIVNEQVDTTDTNLTKNFNLRRLIKEGRQKLQEFIASTRESLLEDPQNTNLTKEEIQKGKTEKTEAISIALKNLYELMLFEWEAEEQYIQILHDGEINAETENTRTKIDTIREQLKTTVTPPKSFEKPEVKLTFKEAEKRLKENGTPKLEDLEQIMTPEIQNAILEEILESIDQKIAAAKKMSEKEVINVKLQSSRIAHIMGSAAHMQLYMQAPISYKKNRIVKPDEIGIMPIKEILECFGYDPEMDIKRRDDIRKYTNILD